MGLYKLQSMKVKIRSEEDILREQEEKASRKEHYSSIKNCTDCGTAITKEISIDNSGRCKMCREFKSFKIKLDGEIWIHNRLREQREEEKALRKANRFKFLKKVIKKIVKNRYDIKTCKS